LLDPGPSIKDCTILPAGVTPWSRDRIRHEPDVCRVYPLATIERYGLHAITHQ
ncbi:hypothetical protein J6590_099776, partial [Homalodisca vitripennis]